jgi:hypothetical protein
MKKQTLYLCPVARIIKVFFWGLVISFLGSLPLGTLNVAAMQIGIQESLKDAVYFSLGSLLVEMVYVRISLVGIDWVRKQQRIMKLMEWITLAIITALAVGSFIAATKGSGAAKNVLLNNNMHRFFAGHVHVCHQSRADPILVWMEHGTFYKKDIEAPGFILQYLYHRHRYRHPPGQLRFYFWR